MIQEQGRLRAALEALERELEYFASQVQKEHDIPSHSPPPVEVPADLPEEAQPAFEPEPSAPPPLPAPSPAPSAEPATANEEPREPESLELELGTVWLARIGIVILVTGFVFLGNYAWQHIVPHLGPGGKVGLLYAAAALLGGAGLALERRRMGTDAGRYGQVLMAGGAATAYYTTYAAHFVERLRIIESPLLGGVLLFFAGALFVWWSDRRRLQTTR